jgi:hypothetical protein
MLTTVDNPYNPYTQWDDWLSFDTHAGYHTLALLGRIGFFSDDLSAPDTELAVQQAIDEIVSENVSGMHKKIWIDDN